MTRPGFVEVDTTFIRMDIKNVTWFETRHWAHLWSMVADNVLHSVRLRDEAGQWYEADYADCAVVLHPGVTHEQVRAYATLFDITSIEYWEALALLAPRNPELVPLTTPAMMKEYEQQRYQLTELGGFNA